MSDNKSEEEPNDDCDDLEEEIARLEQILQEKRETLFQAKRELYRIKLSLPKKEKNGPETFIRPEKIAKSSINSSIEKELSLMLMLNNIQVQSYVKDDHCSILYQMTDADNYVVNHGIRINLENNVKEIEKLSMPLGFELKPIVEQYEDILKSDCLLAIRKGLVAYYSRLEQFNELEKCLTFGAQLFKTPDNSHIEVQFALKADHEEKINLRLMLDYKINDVRPNSISFVDDDLPEGAAEAIKAQCAVLSQEPLARAFKDAFITPCGKGRYKLLEQMSDAEEDPCVATPGAVGGQVVQ